MATHARDVAAPAEAEHFTASLERMNRFQEPEARAAIAALGLPAGSRGLDVGCGVGLYARWLAEATEPASRVLGIEPTAERADAARAFVGSALAPGRLEFRAGDGTALDAADGTFDWVWCGDVLHHILDTSRALAEMVRVLRPGGQLIVKETNVVPPVYLPGHPELERALQLAEMERSRGEGGGRTFQERRQRTRQSMLEAGLADVRQRTYVVPREAPLDAAARAYIQRTVFDRNWGDRLRERLTADEWRRRCALCDESSPEAILARPDYYCLVTFCVFSGTKA